MRCPGLMILIEQCVSDDDQNRREGPFPAPSGKVPGPKSTKQQEGENRVFGEMCGLANEEMPGLELLLGQAGENRMEDLVEQTAGIFAGKIICGQKEDGRHPEQ